MRSSARLAASILLAIATLVGGPSGAVRATHAQPSGPPAARAVAALDQVFADPKYQLTGVAVSGGTGKRTLPHGLFRRKLP